MTYLSEYHIVGICQAGIYIFLKITIKLFQYLHGLQKLAEVMKMDRISLDLGLDMTLDALVSRAEQLAKLEGDAVADRTTHVYNLQRKVSMKLSFHHTPSPQPLSPFPTHIHTHIYIT